MNDFTLSLIFLSTPGIVTTYFLYKLTGECAKDTLTKILEIFIFSLSSYLFLFFIEGFHELEATGEFQSKLSNFFSRDDFDIPFIYIFYAVIVAFCQSYLFSFLWRKGLINRIGSLIRVTHRYNDNTLWDYLQNSQIRALETEPNNSNCKTEFINKDWFFVRDHKLNLLYHCHIRAWQVHESWTELLLENSSVYTNDTGEFLYETSIQYICRNLVDITVETPNISNDEPPLQDGEDPNQKEKP